MNAKTTIPQVRCACEGCVDRDPRPWTEMILIRTVDIAYREDMRAAHGAKSIDEVPAREPMGRICWAHPECISEDYLDPAWCEELVSGEADATDPRIGGVIIEEEEEEEEEKEEKEEEE